MTGTLPCVSDEDLHSFVDGELDPARKKAMLARLAASPPDAARAEAWRHQNEILRSAFAPILSEPASREPLGRQEHAETSTPITAPGSLGAAQDGDRRDRGTAVGYGLAFLAGLATACLAGLVAQRFDPMPHFRLDKEIRTAVARRTDEPFVDRTLRAMVPFEPLPAGSVQSPTPAINEFSIIPNLSDAGLRLTGLRMVQGAPMLPLCLLYVTAADVEVTLCIDPNPGERPTHLRQEADSSRPAISWRQKGARYSLAGALADTQLAAVAERARAEIDKFGSR